MNFDRAIVLELARCYMRAAIEHDLETRTAPATAPLAQTTGYKEPACEEPTTPAAPA